MTSPVWSEWREHVPGPCPVPVGTLVQCDYFDGERREFTFGYPGPDRARGNEYPWLAPCNLWLAPDGRRYAQILRYRIRQYPDAFKQLRQLAEDPGKMAEVCA